MTQRTPLFFLILLAIIIVPLSAAASPTNTPQPAIENSISMTVPSLDSIPEAFTPFVEFLQAVTKPLPLPPVAGSTVMNPPMPCANGVRGNITTAHRYPMGSGPYSTQRSAYDIRCGAVGGGNATDLNIYSSSTGRVYGIANNSDPSKRGIFITDTTYGGCYILWHITASVSRGQTIAVGTFLGRATGAGGHIHIAWTNIPCNGTYGNSVALQERPVQWREIGSVLPRRIYVSQMGSYNYVSQNPANAGGGGGGQLSFARDTRSTIGINSAEVTLSITGSNIAGKTVYARLCRAAANGYAQTSWAYQQTPSGNTAYFGDMEGAGGTFRGVRYFTVVSLNPVSAADCYQFRTACANATGYKQFCDSAIR